MDRNRDESATLHSTPVLAMHYLNRAYFEITTQIYHSNLYLNKMTGSSLLQEVKDSVMCGSRCRHDELLAPCIPRYVSIQDQAAR